MVDLKSVLVVMTLGGALATGSAGAQSMEVYFVLRNFEAMQAMTDGQLLRAHQEVDLQCRFEVDKAAASAGTVVIPGSPGMNMPHSGTAFGGAMSNLGRALTARPPTVAPALSPDAIVNLYFSCMRAKGFEAMGRVDFEALRARHPNLRLRAAVSAW